MTHQTALQEDPDSPIVPESPVPIFNSPSVIPPTPRRYRYRSTKNLLAAFTDLDELQDPTCMLSPDSPIWQSSQREKQLRETSDHSSSHLADTSSSSSGFESAGASPLSAGSNNSKAIPTDPIKFLLKFSCQCPDRNCQIIQYS